MKTVWTTQHNWNLEEIKEIDDKCWYQFWLARYFRSINCL